MSQSPLRPPLTPQEVARRQRWVAVGVTILAILLIGIWVATLPGRITNITGTNATWRMLLGEVPQTNYIDTDKLINPEARQKEQEEFMKVLDSILTATSTAAATTTVSAPSSTPVTAATSTAATSTKQ